MSIYSSDSYLFLRSKLKFHLIIEDFSDPANLNDLISNSSRVILSLIDPIIFLHNNNHTW